MSSEGTYASETPGAVDGTGVRAAVVVARFNADVTERLLRGAQACFEEHDVQGVDVYRVPGAWELPQAAARLAEAGLHDCIVALGCVIRGETPHFHYVCDEASRGLGHVARGASMPVLFGVLTTDDRAQAMARAGDGADNKGYESALAGLQMAALYRELEAL